MKKISKVLAAILVCVMVAGSFAACAKKSDGNDSGKKTYKVGVIQYMSHASLDNCYEGVEKALKEAFGSDVKIERQIGSASAAEADCDTYAKNFVANKYDMIVAIATTAATIAYAATENTNIPVIFCAVSDPMAVELVDSLETPGDICTGTSDKLNMAAQLDLIQSLQPDVKKIGVLYTTSEANSISQLAMLKEEAQKRGIEVIGSGIQSDADIPAAATDLVKKVDCLNNFTDNNVVNNLSVVLEAANEAGIPVYGSEEEQVKNGCLASVSIDYVALGKVTGQMAADVLKGADASKMSVKTISDATPIINKTVLDKLNIKLPDSYSEAETVVSK